MDVGYYPNMLGIGFRDARRRVIFRDLRGVLIPFVYIFICIFILYFGAPKIREINAGWYRFSRYQRRGSFAICDLRRCITFFSLYIRFVYSLFVSVGPKFKRWTLGIVETGWYRFSRHRRIRKVAFCDLQRHVVFVSSYMVSIFGMPGKGHLHFLGLEEAYYFRFFYILTCRIISLFLFQ